MTWALEWGLEAEMLMFRPWPSLWPLPSPLQSAFSPTAGSSLKDCSWLLEPLYPKSRKPEGLPLLPTGQPCPVPHRCWDGSEASLTVQDSTRWRNLLKLHPYLGTSASLSRFSCFLTCLPRKYVLDKSHAKEAFSGGLFWGARPKAGVVGNGGMPLALGKRKQQGSVCYFTFLKYPSSSVLWE